MAVLSPVGAGLVSSCRAFVSLTSVFRVVALNATGSRGKRRSSSSAGSGKEVKVQVTSTDDEVSELTYREAKVIGKGSFGVVFQVG